jgi:hypothetical protein
MATGFRWTEENDASSVRRWLDGYGFGRGVAFRRARLDVNARQRSGKDVNEFSNATGWKPSNVVATMLGGTDA